MSLLYECIQGIIQGGILNSSESHQECEEIAELCVTKLRGLIVIEGDPNCESSTTGRRSSLTVLVKYVALLSFGSIVESHLHLVAAHQDVILNCIDDPDISIRIQALELGSRMVTTENLTAVVGRLLYQLKEAPILSDINPDREVKEFIETAVDSDDEDLSQDLRLDDPYRLHSNPFPRSYRIEVIQRILDMCSRDTYGNITDFEWYLEILIELVKYAPLTNHHSDNDCRYGDISAYIGAELRNLAVRVVAIRPQVVTAAAWVVAQDQRSSPRSSTITEKQGVLSHAIWTVGEYSDLVPDVHDVLESVLHVSIEHSTITTICTCISAIPKLLATVFALELSDWAAQKRTMTTLLLARVLHFLEPLAAHGNLEVQERAVEFIELFRVAREAVSNYDPTSSIPPFLLTGVIPSLFKGAGLGPVAVYAQQKVPLPENLDLSVPFNSSLQILLQQADMDYKSDLGSTKTRDLYYERPDSVSLWQATADVALTTFVHSSHYHDDGRSIVLQPVSSQHPRRLQQTRDDPFYIPSDGRAKPRAATPIDDMIRANNGQEIDIDAIPIMPLDFGGGKPAAKRAASAIQAKGKKEREHVTEEIDIPGVTSTDLQGTQRTNDYYSTGQANPRKALLQVDSSNLGEISFVSSNQNLSSTSNDSTNVERHDAEMAKALAEVERLRMEMQRASDRVSASDIPDDGTLVKKKAHKPKKVKAKYRNELDAKAGDGSLSAVKPRTKYFRKSTLIVADTDSKTS